MPRPTPPRANTHADLSAYRELVDAGATEFTSSTSYVPRRGFWASSSTVSRVPVVARSWQAEAKGRATVSNLSPESTPLAESGGQIADEAPSAEPVPAKLPGPRLPTIEDRQNALGAPSQRGIRGNSSRVTP